MRPPPPLALTALLLGCAARLPAPALALPDLHAHDQPIVLSQRVAIDEAPCEGAALTPLGGLGPVATDQYIALGPGETGLAPLRCFAPVNERRARAATSCASGRWRWIGRCAGSTER